MVYKCIVKCQLDLMCCATEKYELVDTCNYVIIWFVMVADICFAYDKSISILLLTIITTYIISRIYFWILKLYIYHLPTSHLSL